jgi:hypothetical protein
MGAPSVPYVILRYVITSLCPYLASSAQTAPTTHYSLFPTHFPTRLTKLRASFNVKCLSDT